MNGTMHTLATHALLLQADIAPEVAALVAQVNGWVDEARPENLQYEYASSTPYPVATQHHDYQWYYAADCYDPRMWAWTKFHFGGDIESPLAASAYANFELCRKALILLRDTNTSSRWTIASVFAGLALHLAMDDIAHDGFYGRWHEANCNPHAKPCWKIWQSLAPPIGHVQFGSEPDKPLAIWKQADGSVVSNRERFAEFIRKVWTGPLAQSDIDRCGVYQALTQAMTEDDLRADLLTTIDLHGKRVDYGVPDQSLPSEPFTLFVWLARQASWQTAWDEVERCLVR